jgi:hypothetical protein
MYCRYKGNVTSTILYIIHRHKYIDHKEIRFFSYKTVTLSF